MGTNATGQTLANSPAILSKSDLANLREPYEIWLTPFWFRLVVVGLAIFAALTASFALASITLGQAGTSNGLQLAVGTAIGIFSAAMVLRLLNPLDRRKWLRFALARAGLYLPAQGQRLLFVPWSAVVDFDIERWHVRSGERSAATLTLDLDDDFWAVFKRDRHVHGEGRIRRIRLQVVD
ncbi:MAG TPA: hypothetical protein VKA94_02160, partial [Hyphomicrobiales bacterium]|nr:hypothetical protein [Hyphomicrobiales bacterium]